MKQTVEALAWAAKVGTVPTLPSPTDAWADQIYRLLTWLDTSGPVAPEATFSNPGSKTQYTLEKYTKQLGAFELVVRTGDGRVEIGAFGRVWLADPSPARLFQQLHARARFVGELLNTLVVRPRGMAELQDIANDDYGMDWKSFDQTRRRVTWLISLGYAEKYYGNQYVITTSGREILPTLSLQEPGGWQERAQDSTLDQPGASISSLLATLAADDAVDRDRHRGLGYVPSNVDSPIDVSIRRLVELAGNDISADEFVAKTMELFDVSESSARSALGTLRACALFDSTGRATFIASPPARDWLDSGSVLDLIRIVHAATFPVAEVIDLIDEAKRAPALVSAVNQRYGAGSTSSGAISRVVPLLLRAGLIQEVGYARYASSALGRAFAASVPLRASLSDIEIDVPPGPMPIEPHHLADEIAEELADAGTRSDDPQRLERAVAAALNFLGASAEVIGGPGNTDVLATIGTQPSDRVLAIIDAKTSSHGAVSENTVKLDAIEDHRKKHGASRAAIVGPSFGGRLPKWASDKQIALVTTEFLATLVRRHEHTPLGRHDLEALLSGNDKHLALDESLSQKSLDVGLVGIVLEVLMREAHEDDPNITAGLDIDGLYRAVRDQYATKVSKDALRTAADLLASPLVSGVTKDGSYYLAAEPATTVSRRLNALAMSIRDATLAD